MVVEVHKELFDSIFKFIKCPLEFIFNDFLFEEPPEPSN